MDPYLYALISTFVPEHFVILTELAGGVLIKENRNGKTYANGVLHSFDDKPAENWDGIQIWYQNGLKHRDNDLPAVIDSFGTQIWYQNGRYHRNNDQPAILWYNESKLWYQNGKLHRDNDLPAVVYLDAEFWYQHDNQHRANGPAVIRKNGTKEWWQNGCRYK